MSDLLITGGPEESLQYGSSALGIDATSILPFERVSPDQYPAFVRENDATLSFPEKLIMMLMHIEHVCISTGRRPEEEAIHWTNSGDAFVVRDENRLSAVWLRVFFGDTKYSSFTRKLYRWSFHKISPSVYNLDRNQVTIFGSINFHREQKHLVLQMESQTAAKQRRSIMAQQRKIKQQQLLKNKETKTSFNVVPQIDQQADSSSDTLLDGFAKERVPKPVNTKSSPNRLSTHDPHIDVMERLQKGLVLANFLREGGYQGSLLNFQRLLEHNGTLHSLDAGVIASSASIADQPSFAMQLLKQRIQQQEVQYERMQMQALAAIIRNRFAQE
ncbi:hypothetical protein FisN_9Lh398 [Fistulifera solaris]|uniref:HSF-type DNA-binding domain-containing protein n=1 Tax=Fistulifera solaris TaxID=1519565 RepID=A0A1Z5KLC4_FISSO|nr:hypothetical protein FisN_9Lh398 [Fistulifera solaris]|eukprot:GAX27076.1 hypothetical protein FisN_9Lh398 [Fistulifera solaris]